MSIARRVLAEKRRLIWALGIALAVNAGIYLVAVYPLAARVAGARVRAAQAAAEVERAEAASARARATVRGRERADQELRKFYSRVLPADQTGARRITYLRLAQLAERARLRYERRTVTAERDRESTLSKLRMTMVLAGEYANVRQFIYELETAPEFVVIEDVALAQGEDRNAPLVLTLEVSTYFLAGTNGT
jgi:Tfp pilus assembly protein PilO